MKFIRLNRTFVLIKHAGEVTADAIEAWGRHGSGAKTWPELLEAQRVVVLAEANSGKTGEFQDQVARLEEEGKDGFFAAIEAVAENGFINALPRGDRLRFEAWKATSRPGWFLLDSLDEARIRQKTLETALGALERDLGELGAGHGWPRASGIVTRMGQNPISAGRAGLHKQACRTRSNAISTKS